MSFTANLAPWAGLMSVLACLALNGAAATSLEGPSWGTEPGVSPPSYALTEPTESDLNVDTVVLVCSETGQGRALELDLYLAEPGPLLPNNADPRWLKERPSVEISIDGRTFRADLLFSDDHVVVTDASDRRRPILSAALLDAMQSGRTMVLRFDLLKESPDGASRFDSLLVIDLRSGQSAIASVRRCTSPNAYAAAR